MRALSDDMRKAGELADFLVARATELRVRAKQAPTALDPPPPGQPFRRDLDGHPIYEPQGRLFAEVEAVRTLVDCWDSCKDLEGMGTTAYRGAMMLALRCAAVAFRDHPDYRQEWRI